jgi:hypothetical protein
VFTEREREAVGPESQHHRRREEGKGRAMAGIGPIRRDWEPVVVRKKAPNTAAKNDEKAVNATVGAESSPDTNY